MDLASIAPSPLRGGQGLSSDVIIVNVHVMIWAQGPVNKGPCFFELSRTTLLLPLSDGPTSPAARLYIIIWYSTV